jgi:intracellular septation protein
MTKKKQLNPFLKLVLDIGPLVLFFAANAKLGIYVATGAFMAAILIALVVSYVLTKHVAIMPLVTAVIVLVFGGLTLVLHDELFIKLKPTIIYVLFGGTLVGGLAFNKPLLGMVFDSVFHLRDSERDCVAHPNDGFLGEFQIVRRRAADICICRTASSAAQQIQS